MILVFGSTGTVGGEVTRQLIAAGQKPRLLVRDPVKAKKFEGKAEIIKGDIGDAKILAEALKGADKVFLATAGVDGPELEARIIDAAKSAGVKHVVKLSLMGAESEAVAFGRWHRQSEKKLEASGLKWTFLRSGHFMSNALLWADDIKGQGTINLPAGEGKSAVIDPSDIAAVAVKALTSSGHDSKAYTLTGPQALSTAEQASTLSTIAGKKINYVDVAPEDARASMLKTGMPKAYVDGLMEAYALIRNDQTSTVTNTVEEVTGHRPIPFESWVKKNAGAFK